MAGFEFQAGGSTSLQPTRPGDPQDWEAKRESISQYYIQEDCTLDQLQATMLRKHGFYATRRQYCTKLKQWNLRKNLAASDKDRIIDKIVAARLLGHTIAEVRFHDRQIDPKLLLKHAQSHVPYSDTGSITNQVQILHRTRLRRDSTRPATAETTDDHIQIIYRGIASPESGSPKSDSDNEDWTVVVNGPVTKPSQYRLENNERLYTPQVFPALSYSPTVGLEKIISLSQDYILATLESRIQSMLAPPDETHLLSWLPDVESAAMHSFWVDIKNSLYMAKKHEKNMTFTFASRACAAIQAPTTVETNLGTLKDVLATLSPTNARSCLPLRDGLLHYLSEILGMRFGMQHPLAILCGELRQETSNLEIYEIALRFAIELIEITQGTQPSDNLAFRRELIRLLRRSGALYESEKLCVEQETYCVREFGTDALVTRRATSDLVHVLMAKKELVQAMAICEDLIERSRRHLAKAFPDELAVYALEDLAELCELHESPTRSLFLLHESYFGAVRLWGAGASTTEYILSKIQVAICATCFDRKRNPDSEEGSSNFENENAKSNSDKEEDSRPTHESNHSDEEDGSDAGSVHSNGREFKCESGVAVNQEYISNGEGTFGEDDTDDGLSRRDTRYQSTLFEYRNRLSWRDSDGEEQPDDSD
ncbi:hypothetical protein TW65_04919 [Stemphylium lycopersici]|nr:hypothetical protein TW65_04919 [Stemphylium lycopersici]